MSDVKRDQTTEGQFIQSSEIYLTHEDIKALAEWIAEKEDSDDRL